MVHIILLCILKSKDHLTALEEGMIKYFSDLEVSEYDWINDPFDGSISFSEYSLEEEVSIKTRKRMKLECI